MAMKVFNLACEHEHAFEGWFASAEAYDSQLERGLVECPMCGSRKVERRPSAPRLNLSSASAEAPKPGTPPTPERVQALWMKMARHIADHTEDVGERFAEEARRIHHEEAPVRGIRGVASREETAELQAEGIEVFSFPMPKLPKGPLQ